jgi:3-keto-5-aminohexanoate cleavage enzyme
MAESHPVIITAALVGGELTRKDTPHLPLSPSEIAEEGVLAAKEGAAVLHLHARDEQGKPRHETEIFRKIVEEIRSRCAKAKIPSPILQFSTGGSVGMSLEERLAPLTLKPEMATLTTGTVNFGREIFENSAETMETIAKTLRASRIGVEIEIFDAGMIDNALTMLRNGDLQAPLHFNFVLGVPGGLGGDPENLFYLVKRIPADSTWSVAGIGRYQLPLATLALVLGGHVRVGLEDNVYYQKGVLSEGNAPLVARVARLARELGRALATPAQAREILHLPAGELKK